MEYLFIYGLQIFDFVENLKIIAWVSCITLGIMNIVIFLEWYDHLFDDDVEYYQFERKAFNWGKKATFTIFSIALFLTVIPTKQTLLLMGGTYLGKKAINEVVQSDKMEKINTIIDLQLDKYIKELQGATK